MKKLSFLVVDDSQSIREQIAKSLTILFGNDNIMLAENGKMALQLLRESPADIIISDWQMPVHDGEELLYNLRNNPEFADYKETPFVMMNDNSDRDFIIMAIQLGVSQYIVKPFSINELETKIRAAINTLNRRASKRYTLPAHVAGIHVGTNSFSGQVLDLSRTGAAITRLKYDPKVTLFKNCELEIKLIDPKGLESDTSLISLFGRVVRLEAEDTFHPTSLDYHLALYFHPGTMERDVERKLNSLIKWLATRTPDIIGGS